MHHLRLANNQALQFNRNIDPYIGKMRPQTATNAGKLGSIKSKKQVFEFTSNNPQLLNIEKPRGVIEQFLVMQKEERLQR